VYGKRDEFFFHYTTAEAAFEYIIPDRQLRLTPYSGMRDPLEYKEWEPGDFAGAYFKEGLDDDDALVLLAKATDALNLVRRKVKVLAMTVDPPESEETPNDPLFARGYASARLWEHYAENHAGVCLVFRREELDQRITKAVAGRPQPANGPAAVLYRGHVQYTTSGWAGATSARSLVLGPETLDPLALGRHFEAHHEAIFFLKTRDWATEYEYRFAVLTAGEGYEYIDYGDSLHAVIVGERFPLWQAPGVLELCDEANAEAKQLTWIKEGPFVVPLVPWSELDERQRERAQQRRRGGHPRLPSG
jgi:hypothetical protein